MVALDSRHPYRACFHCQPCFIAHRNNCVEYHSLYGDHYRNVDPCQLSISPTLLICTWNRPPRFSPFSSYCFYHPCTTVRTADKTGYHYGYYCLTAVSTRGRHNPYIIHLFSSLSFPYHPSTSMHIQSFVGSGITASL